MNIIEAIDLLYEDRKIYNTLWHEKGKYFCLNNANQLVDQDGIEVEASEILTTHNWEEYVLITEEEKTILKSLLTLNDFEGVKYITIYKATCFGKVGFYTDDGLCDDYIYHNISLFKNIANCKKYTLKELELC